MTFDLQQFNTFVFRYTISVSAAVLSAVCCILLLGGTPKSRRWTIPFNLALILLFTAVVYFVFFAVHYYFTFPVSYDQVTSSVIGPIAGASSDVYLLIGEISLCWMVSRVYPTQMFRRKILPFIVLFIVLRVSIALWFLLEYYINGTVIHTVGVIFSVLVMWNCFFFSALFIYRYRKKLRAATRSHRLFQSILNFSIRNAIIPTICVIGPIITLLLPKTSAVQIADTLTITVFRVAYGTLIAYSLHLINCGKSRANDQRRERTVFNHAQLTALNFISSFGVEKRVEKIIENFLAQVYEKFGGDIGYFVEKNRFGQVSVICGFSFVQRGSTTEVQLFSTDGNTASKIPTAALEYGLDLSQISVTDFKFVDENESELCALLSDRIDLLDSVLILPVTASDSSKHKIIYIERYSTLDTFSESPDLHSLEPLAYQFAASLECSR